MGIPRQNTVRNIKRNSNQRLSRIIQSYRAADLKGVQSAKYEIMYTYQREI